MDSNSASDILPAEPTLENANGDESILSFLQKAREAAELFFTLKDADDWKLETDKKGVAMYSKPSGGSIDYTKRTMEVAVSKDELVQFIVDPENIKA
mmetsp:Transcript_34133/g.39382  ORF Transcript_34133/g.39382 Transcript_34133/m.39382 type:complete len:97 (+) Transcript_34133:43-333(+)